MNKRLISFEEAKDDLIRQLHENEQASPAKVELTEEDEYRIVMSKGIEYVCGEIKIYVKPLKVSGINKLCEIKGLQENKKISEVEKLNKIVEKIAPILKVDVEKLKDNMDTEDLKNICDLLTYSMANGREIFNPEKKTVTQSEIRALRKVLIRRTI